MGDAGEADDGRESRRFCRRGQFRPFRRHVRFAGRTGRAGSRHRRLLPAVTRGQAETDGRHRRRQRDPEDVRGGRVAALGRLLELPRLPDGLAVVRGVAAAVPTTDDRQQVADHSSGDAGDPGRPCAGERAGNRRRHRQGQRGLRG